MSDVGARGLASECYDTALCYGCGVNLCKTGLKKVISGNGN
jgi:hypothetical protein